MTSAAGGARHRARPAEPAPDRIVVRRLGRDDTDLLAHLAGESGRFSPDGQGEARRPLLPDEAGRFLNDDRTICLVALDRERSATAGFLYAHVLYRRHTQLEHLCLYEFGIAKEYRGQGVSQKLLDSLGRHARERGIAQGFYMTDVDNQELVTALVGAGALRTAGSEVLLLQF